MTRPSESSLFRLGKISFYWTAKHLGLFRLARYATGSGLRVLCFHGISSSDEHVWRPNLFVSPEHFAQRMQYLDVSGYNVISLDEALVALREQTLPDSAVVITFDDGYYTTYSEALPVLRGYGFSATVYLITHCLESGKPLFNYLVGYLLWKSGPGERDLSALGVPGVSALVSTGSERASDFDDICRRIVSYGEQLDTESQRVQLCVKLAAILGHDYDAIADGRSLSLVSKEEAREMHAAGMNIEMHSHFHRFPGLPEDGGPASLDIAENIVEIEKVIGRRPRHFCYPFGMWTEDHWGTLAHFGIESAATCDPGFVYSGDNPYSLNRMLDNQNMSEIEFEAMFSGFVFVAQPLRRLMRHAYRGLVGSRTSSGATRGG